MQVELAARVGALLDEHIWCDRAADDALARAPTGTDMTLHNSRIGIVGARHENASA